MIHEVYDVKHGGGRAGDWSARCPTTASAAVQILSHCVTRLTSNHGYRHPDRDGTHQIRERDILCLLCR